MVRAYTAYVEDEKGRPVFQAWCRAFNITNPSEPTLEETQYSDTNGAASFVALPDDAPVDIWCLWGQTNSKYFRNVLSSDGDDIDSAVDKSHTQNTDDYALGAKAVLDYPASPVEGEIICL